jgi:peptidoglycan/LPS O-acetylase OafA/YrhL
MKDRAHPEFLAVLDGWRALSILLVLAAHLLPLGPKSWQLNATAGVMGMSLFFCLSGFLITRLLLTNPSVGQFLIKRTFRILPLAWVALLMALVFVSAPASQYLPNFLFYANLPPQQLANISSHYWSLCIEMQFYFGAAFLVFAMGKRWIYAIPILCLAITLHRVLSGAQVDIVTWRRVDEIFVGCALAVIYSKHTTLLTKPLFTKMNSYVFLVALLVCCHPSSGFLNYFRPYIAATLVASTLFCAPAQLKTVLEHKTLAYIAAISFALYVIHHLLQYMWFGDGEKLTMYAKRPLLIALTFVLAHLSTFYFERPMIRLGNALCKRISPPALSST